MTLPVPAMGGSQGQQARRYEDRSVPRTDGVVTGDEPLDTARLDEGWVRTVMQAASWHDATQIWTGRVHRAVVAVGVAVGLVDLASYGVGGPSPGLTSG
jgi:hypothetical protein